MIKVLELVILPGKEKDKDLIYSETAKKLKIDPASLKAAVVKKRSLDARSKTPIYRLSVDAYINETPQEKPHILYQNVEKASRKVAIIGFGPAGMFAALRLLELGIKPIVFERGKDVQSRRKDLRGIQQFGLVDPDSNYCFGEGGAGTYSDGKLYTRSTKRGDVNKILSVLAMHGAHEDITIDAHPHIGSNKLPKVVQAVRETVINHGGEIFFNSRVEDIIIENKTVKGVVVGGKEHQFDSVILATGHSARDIFILLKDRGVKLESKPFAMGVRIEHPQALINEIQYCSARNDLPAASYNLACQVKEKGVFSFCMCPGGIIIPASTDSEELVLNGMSISRRDSPYANSGFVAAVNEKDWLKFESYGEFAGLELQKEVERIAFIAGGGKQVAPAQRITDFVDKKISSSLPKTSYIPGTISAPLHDILPSFIAEYLRQGIIEFGKKMRGYYTEEAQILAAETRTSSPIRIPRDRETFMHTEIAGLFPAGEGAGYAGGIVSAAIDGENCAEAAAKRLALS